MSKDAGRGGVGQDDLFYQKSRTMGGRQLATGGDWWGFATPGMGACLELEMLTPIDLSRYGGPPSKAISPDGSEWCHRVNQAPHQEAREVWIRRENLTRYSRGEAGEEGQGPGDGVLDLAGGGGCPGRFGILGWGLLLGAEKRRCCCLQVDKLLLPICTTLVVSLDRLQGRSTRPFPHLTSTSYSTGLGERKV